MLYEKKLIGLSTHDFLLWHPNSQKIEGIFNEGLRKVLNNQLPLASRRPHMQFFFFIGSQNRFHFLISCSYAFNLHITEYYSPIWQYSANQHLQFLSLRCVRLLGFVKIWSDASESSICECCTKFKETRGTVCIFKPLWVCWRVGFTRAAVAAHP